jgi:hypothetical protein
MMASNQPFRRVDDGIGSGLVGGAVVGGAMAGGFRAGGGLLASKIASNRITGTSGARAGLKTMKAHNKLKGYGWKGKTMAYGGSILAAGLMGAGLDAMND